MASKLLGIFILLSAALTSGVYLAGAHEPRGKTASVSAPEIKTAELPEKENTALLFESLPPRVEEKGSESNATRALAVETARTIIDKNPNGPNTEGGMPSITALNPEMLVNEVLADALAHTDYSSFQTHTPFSELVITKDETQSAFAAYFAKLDAALATAKKEMPAIDTSFPLKAFTATADVLEELVATIKSLPVPTSIKDLHQEQVDVLSTEKNIFRAIGGASADAVRGVAAFHLLPEVLRNLKALEPKFIEVKTAHGVE